MPKIKKITAHEILDSRGDPTIEAKVILDDYVYASAAVPSGASTGKYEALEIRDNDLKRYRGMGVLKAVENVNTKIAKALSGVEATNQQEIDKIMLELDGTENKTNLGANAILAVSLACARVVSVASGIPLYEYLGQLYGFEKKKGKMPIPMFNIFNGGKHADTNLDFQEFMIVPHGVKSFKERVRAGSEIFHALGRVLRQRGFDTDIGNEGGYAPDLSSSIQAIEMILAAIIDAGYKPDEQVSLATDVGSSVLFDENKLQYIFKLDHAMYSNNTLIGLYNEWLRKYPFIAIEDGLAEDDWQGWKRLTADLGNEIMLVGDDLFVTNVKRLERGIKENVANAILIKPNQVGTLTETMDCVKMAQENKYKVVVSHRSGETTDDFIADLAVAVNAEYIKTGSLSRGERLAKYNRLMAIEEELS